MFKVKATVVGFLGDVSKYPCHFNHKVGDEIIWTGAELKGRLCPAILPMVAEKVAALYAAGPRYVDPAYYFPFWYAPASTYDPSLKKYDGIGFKPILHTVEDIKYGMSALRPSNSFKWPPHPERTVARDNVLVCPDYRTALVLKLEAFDLADDGDSVIFFRRMMSILSKVPKKPGLAVDKILDQYTKEQIEGIHPPLSQILVGILVEELELIGYLEVKNGKANITKKGEEKLKNFKASLPAEDREALKDVI
jgi:uncharacterized repeat protein (TIGR04076 family)